jgi:hypothetical protein
LGLVITLLAVVSTSGRATLSAQRLIPLIENHRIEPAHVR